MNIGHLIVTVANIFLYALLARVVIDYIRIFKRDWRPKGVVLVFVESVYSVTDPPMRFVGKYVPPLRVGGMSIDLAFIVLFLAVRFISGLVYNL